jgi:hypothetical protein
MGGEGGLGLTGVGEGGGSDGLGIGLGHLGGLGHTDGPVGSGRGGAGSPPRGGGWAGGGWGRGWGFGVGHSGKGLGKAPTVRMCDYAYCMLSGRLPAEVIQRIVRQSFGRFRACYEVGLKTNPRLQGRVSTSFVIGRDGAVSSATNAGSDLPDPAVVSCVVRAFYGISFPQPEGGIVTVTYPITFSPLEAPEVPKPVIRIE